MGRVTWKLILFSGAVLGAGLAIASCLARTDAALTELLGQPLMTGQHEAIAARYREKAGEARLLASTHVTMASRYHTCQQGGRLSPDLCRAMEEHCRALAADYEDAAARYETLATSHASVAHGFLETPSRERADDRKF
jgi:hypothetical protein